MSSLASMLRTSHDKDIIQIYNTMKPFHWQKNSICLVSEVSLLPSTPMTVRFRLMWCIFLMEATPNSSTGYLCTSNQNTAFHLALAPVIKGEEWNSPREDCWWTCASDMLMQLYRQDSLGWTESLLLQRKGNSEAQMQNWKWQDEIQAILQNHLDTSLYECHYS